MKVKNRAWVKNAAIIFLSVLLVLTFFSNTILNRSLPEVSGQNMYGGEISTAVRGTGTVNANAAYSLTVDTKREVTKVHVKTGDVVEAGQVLFELDEADSTDLEAAIDALELLQYNYNKKVLSLSSDYELEELNYTLEDALEEQQKSIAAADALEAAKAKNESAQQTLKLAKEEIVSIQARIDEINAEITAGIDEDLLTGDMKKKKAALEQAKKDYEYAKEQYESGGSSVNLTPYVTAVSNAAAAEGQALIAAALAMDLMYQSHYIANTSYGEGQAAYNKYYDEAKLGAAADTAKVNSLLNAMLNHEANARVPEVIAWQDAVKAHKEAQQQLDAMSTYTDSEANLKAIMESAKGALDRAQKAWDEAIDSIRIEGKQERETLKAQLKTKNTALIPIEKAATEASDDYDKAKLEAATTPEAAAEKVRLAQKAVNRKLEELESSQALQDLELARDRDEIADQQKVVDKLREKEVDTEVKTRYGGTVLSVDVMVGDKTSPETTLATIEINGKGYTLEFSVSNEEVQRVRVGDIATISSWGRGDTVLTLVAIKTDRDNPTRRKILEFDVTGDNVVAGQNLEVSVGSRTQYYNYVVPNSAIREDADGKFVLVATTKSTPLGPRYIATKVDITVIDSDSKNSAVNGDFEGWSPYVITTSSKPIEPNTQVRLA